MSDDMNRRDDYSLALWAVRNYDGTTDINASLRICRMLDEELEKRQKKSEIEGKEINA